MQYEIEIKVLLGEKEIADRFRDDIHRQFSDLKLVDTNSQLNHYFVGGNFTKLKDMLTERKVFENDETGESSFDTMVREGKKFSVRTRFVNGVSILVVKFSVDDTTSENGTARREWEHEFSLSIEELDQMLLDADFEYQAKWSREREEYKSEGVNICLDKNAGYGYVAEFEKILGLEDDLDTAKEELRAMISDLGYEELDQERLERMFAYYNENWRDYYGTENTFEME